MFKIFLVSVFLVFSQASISAERQLAFVCEKQNSEDLIFVKATDFPKIKNATCTPIEYQKTTYIGGIYKCTNRDGGAKYLNGGDRLETGEGCIKMEPKLP